MVFDKELEMERSCIALCKIAVQELLEEADIDMHVLNVNLEFKTDKGLGTVNGCPSVECTAVFTTTRSCIYTFELRWTAKLGLEYYDYDQGCFMPLTPAAFWKFLYFANRS